MKRLASSKTFSRWLPTLGLIALLIILLAMVYALVLRSPTSLYQGTDFLGYWGAANLLAHRENPYDHDALLALEREQGWLGREPVFSWNPPWLHLLLLPLGALPFRQAAALWFLANPLLIGLSALLIWHTVSKRRGPPHTVLALLATFVFSRSLHAMVIGQTNSLVLLGCAGFLALQSRDLLAGALFVLVTVKPHLAYLLLPTLLFNSLLRRRWRIIVGFSACLMLLVLLVSWLFPSWPGAYLSLLEISASPQNYPYITPTIRGLLLAYTNFDIGIWPAVVCLAIFLIVTSLRGYSLDLPTIASLSFLVGLPTAPFGWSTDQVLLLLPVLQIVAWTPRLTSAEKRVVMFSLILIYSYALWFWVVSYQEVAFLVLPLAIGLLWGYAYRKALGGGRTVSDVAAEFGGETQH